MVSNWKALAVQEANRQGVRADLVLATVEAETNGQNIRGDNGNAVGYGQVWVIWHKDAFIAAAQLLGLSIPSDNESLKSYTLSNDQYSMAVTVCVIKQIWNASGGDWGTFTRKYVGPQIPSSDFNRRLAIWNKYQGSNGNYGDSYVSYDATPSTDNPIAATNFGVIKDSYKLGDVLYGRRYRVFVSDKNGVAFDVSDLRCTFNIVKTMLMQLNYSEITIYNLNAQTENTIMKEGLRVVLEAGYEGSQYGLIFDGDLIQTVRDKEDGVTFVLTLRALDGDRFSGSGIVNFSLLRGQNPRSIIENCVSKASVPAQLGSISDNLGNSKLTRGKVVFGLARDYLKQVAQSQNATFYLDDGKVNIVHAADLPQGEIIELSPTTGLIGVPQQTEFGVSAKCLLNPRLRINTLVHIDNSLVRDISAEVGQAVRQLDNDGIYRVISVTYIGDTRGQDWYCDFETVSQAGVLPDMISNSLSNPF